MAKGIEMYIKRRGRRYLIKRNSDGTFGKWIALTSKKGGKKVAPRKISASNKSKRSSQTV